MTYGLIGERLGHSFSKQIHAKIADYDYSLCEIAPENLAAFFEKRDFSGVNVTIPYKQAVMPLLDFIDEAALEIGAVNTVVNRAGKLYGYNTDFDGMRELILRENVSLQGKKVLILGSGGTSKTAFAVAKGLGAREIVRASRTGRDGAVTYEDVLREHLDCEIIINTTPVGMYPDTDGTPIDISRFGSLKGVFDAVYNPLRTNLVLDAHERNIPACGGLFMLVAQAIFAYSHFTDTSAKMDLAEKIYNELLREKENLVLIGMPSCGKSTIGARLASALSLPLVDTDAEIVRLIGMPIADLFAQKGEAEFRRIESEVIAKACAEGGKIISTGGGAVKSADNVRRMRRSGKVFFIDRALPLLLVSADRPLSSSAAAVEKLYNERLALYRGAADVVIDNSGNLDDAINLILRECML